MENKRTDAMLMEILRERKTITGFLDAVFGFLKRNTDFYHNKKDCSEEIGFEKGAREQILFRVMERYDADWINQLSHETIIQENNVHTVDNEIDVVSADIEMENKALEKVVSAPTTTVQANPFFAKTDYKNGALCDRYCWSQTIKDIEVHVKLPTELYSAKLINVEVKPNSISVQSRLDANVAVISGKISNKFKHNDAVWTVDDGGRLLISFDKAQEKWWDKLFDNEKSINLKKIDCERFIDELPEESQAAMQKLRIQQMEQDNKHKSDSIATNKSEALEKLRKAWDAEGSPFKGQPFDPSVLQFN